MLSIGRRVRDSGVGDYRYGGGVDDMDCGEAAMRPTPIVVWILILALHPAGRLLLAAAVVAGVWYLFWDGVDWVRERMRHD